MYYAAFYYSEISVKICLLINLQRILFIIEEIITFFAPGIIWFYYSIVTQDEECKAPIEESFAILVSCYFACSIFLILPIFNMCAKKICCDFCCVPFLYSVYLIGKFVLLIIMLTNVQNDYDRSWEDWDTNLCPNLKDFTLAWLIINYVMLACTFIYSIFFMGIAFCDCDYDWSEYDIDY